MSDIVERLRAKPTFENARDAADEIEQLRKHEWRDKQLAEWQTEVERLRRERDAALAELQRLYKAMRERHIKDFDLCRDVEIIETLLRGEETK